MKTFWEESYDGVKDRRYGLLFLKALLGFSGALVLCGILCAKISPDDFQTYILPALPGVGILIIALGWHLIRRARKRRREYLKFASLSRDELLKARSKLRNRMQPAKPAMPRLPDIDLKY